MATRRPAAKGKALRIEISHDTRVPDEGLSLASFLESEGVVWEHVEDGMVLFDAARDLSTEAALAKLSADALDAPAGSLTLSEEQARRRNELVALHQYTTSRRG